MPSFYVVEGMVNDGIIDTIIDTMDTVNDAQWWDEKKTYGMPSFYVVEDGKWCGSSMVMIVDDDGDDDISSST